MVHAWTMHGHVTRTDKNLNSRTAKYSQGLVRTCQVLDQSLQVPLLALQVLDQSLPVLGNPGDTLPRTGIQKKSKTNSGLIRAKYTFKHGIVWTMHGPCMAMHGFEGKSNRKNARKRLLERQWNTWLI